LSEGTSISYLKLFGSMTFQWRICTTWMKRDANEEVGERSQVESILFLALDVLDIGSVVQISSLLQSLNVFVRMGLFSSLDLSFQARNSLQNGSRSIQRSGMSVYMFVSVCWLTLPRWKHRNVGEWLDR
jgi:hypothetical protein